MTDFKSSTSSLTFIFFSTGISKFHELEKISLRNWTKLRIPSLTKALLQKQQEISTNVEQFTLKVEKKLFPHPPSKLFLSSSVRTRCTPYSSFQSNTSDFNSWIYPCHVVEPIYRIVWKVRERRRKVSLELFLIPRSTPVWLAPEVGHLSRRKASHFN